MPFEIRTAVKVLISQVRSVFGNCPLFIHKYAQNAQLVIANDSHWSFVVVWAQKIAQRYGKKKHCIRELGRVNLHICGSADYVDPAFTGL